MVSRVPSFRSGRSLRAVLLGALILIVGVSAAGLASVHEVPGGTAVTIGTFGVPEPRVGDRGTYLRLDPTGVPIPFAEDPFAFTFEWLPGGVMLNRTLVAHETHRLALYTAPPEPSEWDPQNDLHVEWHIDRLDFSLVATSTIMSQPTTGRGVFGTGDHTATWHVSDMWAADGAPQGSPPPTPVPCGLLTPLQGAQVPVDEAWSYAGCSRPEISQPRYAHVPATYGFEGAFVWNGTTYADYRPVSFGTAPDGRPYFDGYAHVRWMRFSEAVPYPVSLELRTYGRDGYEEVRLVLADLVRGEEPLSGSTGERRPLPPVATSPAPPWGLDDSGVEHPYPLREAWQEAMADPRFAEEVAFFQRDEVELYHVGFEEYETDGRTFLQWQIEATDGDHTAVVCPMRVYPSAQGDRGPVGLPFVRDVMQDDTNLTRCDPAQPELHVVEPVDRPTVLWMRSVWDELAPGLGLAHVEPLAYGFTMEGHPDEDPEPVYRIGSERWDSQLVPLFTSPVVPAGRAIDRFEVEFDAAGNLSHIRVARYSDEFRGPLALPSGVAREEPVDQGAEVYRFEMPQAPTFGAVAALALALALLYALWPFLKTLPGLSLFSRIGRPKVLDHEMRARIADAVRAEPGVHAEALRRQVEAAHGAFQHHVRLLVMTGVLGRRKVGGRVCYYPKGEVDVEMVDRQAAVRSPAAQRILAAWQAEPDLTGSVLAERLGLSRQAVHYHMKRLKAAGLAP